MVASRSKRRILITGGTGLLGSELIKLDNSIIAPSRAELDLLNPESIKRTLLSHHSNILIHCAAITQAKMKEVGEEITYVTNCMGSMILARLCKKYDIEMIYISTDYVFNGKEGNYSEDKIPHPLNFYATTKLIGEIASLSLHQRVIRTSFCPKEWPYDMAFEDKYTSGDTVDVIADLILRVVHKIGFWRGVLHVGTQRKTFYELASKTGKEVRKNSINDVEISIPRDTSFDLSRLNQILERSDFEL